MFSIDTAKLPKLYSDEPLMSWLLRAAGIVPEHVMRDALDVSRKGELSPFEILRLSGRLSQSDLRAAERAIQFIEANLIYRDFAAIALSHACAQFVEFDDALWDLGLHPSDPFGGFRLFELLDDCAMLPAPELLEIRKECLSRGVTLGFALIKNGKLSGQLLKVLLECLSAVSSKKLEYHELVLTVISILRDTDIVYGTAEKAVTHEARLVAQLPIATSDRALGNLLLCANLVELSDLVFCLEVALEDNRSLGSVLSDFMMLDPVVLQAARSLAYMTSEKKVTARRSVELLEEVKATGMPLQSMFSDGTSLTVLNGMLGPVSSIA